MRPAYAADLDAIQVLIDRAFSHSKYESKLLACLFGGQETFFSWVEERHGKLIACIVYTPAMREDTRIGYHLAPIAVDPSFQGQGIGSRIIRESLLEDPLKDAPVFVLGDPLFYERFGFKAVTNPGCSYDPGNHHFRALRWEEPVEHFTVGYAKAFLEAE